MTLISRIRDILGTSVFRRMKGKTQSDQLAAWFHRVASIQYFIYSLWAAVSMFVGLPAIVREQGMDWSILYSVFVLICTGPAFLGATFFPKFARTEMFAGGAFAVQMLIYIYFAILNANSGDGSWAGVVILTAILVKPFVRTSVIIFMLIAQANERRHQEVTE